MKRGGKSGGDTVPADYQV